jgi:regulator of protease activity HflC (stomatin/prohibitin superfamily)
LDPGNSWRSALLDTISRKDEIFAEIVTAQEKEREVNRIKAEQEKELNALNAEAKKLKVL